MNFDEAGVVLAYANQIDPRVQFNKPTTETWHRGLYKLTREEATDAIQQFYANRSPEHREPILPWNIRRIAAATRERRQGLESAREAALAALPAGRRPPTYKQLEGTVRERFAEQYEEGRRQAAAAKGSN